MERKVVKYVYGFKCLVCGEFVTGVGDKHSNDSLAFFNGMPYPCCFNGE